MNQIIVTGMVLSSAPIGEYDRRVVILTKERGRISAFARGARRPNSALVGMTAPFSFGEFTVYEGRTSYTMVSASISNYFSELREDVEGAYYGFYFLELAGYYTREANDETQMLKLLYQTMRALLNPHLPNKLIRYIYELRAVAINGEAPQLYECVSCGKKGEAEMFSVQRGGLLCGQCQKKASDARKILPSTLYAMQFIVATPMEKLFTFKVKEDVLAELGQIIGSYLETYVDKRFKSLEILETIVE